MEQLAELPAAERDKVWFIHFNHSNPLLDPGGAARQEVEAAGFHVAEEGIKLPM